MSLAWKASVTVAAIVECDGRFLLVQEETPDGIRINQPAGHLDPGESLLEAVARETLEETARHLTATHLVGVYMWRSSENVAFVRFAFAGRVSEPESGRPLDHGILRTLWLTREELAARAAEHRSPLVLRCIDDYLAGRRFPIELIVTHQTVRGRVPAAASSVIALAGEGGSGEAECCANSRLRPLETEEGFEASGTNSALDSSARYPIPTPAPPLEGEGRFEAPGRHAALDSK